MHGLYKMFPCFHTYNVAYIQYCINEIFMPFKSFHITSDECYFIPEKKLYVT